MKVLFQCEQLNYRGTTNSTIEYALYNQKILGNESVIAYCSIDPPGRDVGTKPEIVEKLKKDFQVLSYETFDELNELASKFDACYSQRAGYAIEPDTRKPLVQVKTTHFAVHSVFQWWEPHGDAYAYISEWLANEITEKYVTPDQQKFVPYIVDLPPPNECWREKYGIPKDKYIFGRHGGYNTFDLDIAIEVVKKVADSRDDFVFLFPNTSPFFYHPNVVFLDPFYGNQEKSNFIACCDAMLHGRHLGETFGLSIAEFLFHNKPVLSWEGGFDRNHVNWLSGYDLLYKDEADLYNKMIALPSRDKSIEYSNIVRQYNPKNVMQKFQEIFLSK